MLFAARTVLDQLPQVGDLVSLLSHLFSQLLDQGQQFGQSAGHDIWGGGKSKTYFNFTIPIELIVLLTITVPIDHRYVSSAGHNRLSTRCIVVLPKSTIFAALPITNITLAVLLGAQSLLFTQLVLHLHAHKGGL